MNFSNVRGVTIPEGNVQVISVNGQVIWQAIKRMKWMQSNIASDEFQAVAYANDLWVAGSESKGLYYSADGQTWIQSNIKSGRFVCVINANGICVASSDYNQGLYYSDWTPPTE